MVAESFPTYHTTYQCTYEGVIPNRTGGGRGQSVEGYTDQKQESTRMLAKSDGIDTTVVSSRDRRARNVLHSSQVCPGSTHRSEAGRLHCRFPVAAASKSAAANREGSMRGENNNRGLRQPPRRILRKMLEAAGAAAAIHETCRSLCQYHLTPVPSSLV